VIKHSAATAGLLKHSGRAVIFESVEDMIERIDQPDLDVEEGDVLVLRNAGLKGAPGMPEAGGIPIPKKLSRKGVKDMVRITDARMSGSGFGTVVLHVSPEAADGGPLGRIRNGDIIELDVAARTLNVLVDDEELASREPSAAVEVPARGYARLYLQSVLQADEGADFDFLAPAPSGKDGPARS
jgi:dihydroxy-acid dehydratase